MPSGASPLFCYVLCVMGYVLCRTPIPAPDPVGIRSDPIRSAPDPIRLVVALLWWSGRPALALSTQRRTIRRSSLEDIVSTTITRLSPDQVRTCGATACGGDAAVMVSVRVADRYPSHSPLSGYQTRPVLVVPACEQHADAVRAILAREVGS